MSRRLTTEWRVAVMVVLLGWPAASGLARDRYHWDFRQYQAYYQAAARVVERATEPGSVIIATQHVGSLRYYAGRMTLRFDYLDRAWLDQTVAWLAERGIKTYALLEFWEVDDWRERFAAANRLGRLDMPPIRTIERPVNVHLYDLTSSAPVITRSVALTAGDADCRPPASLPAPAWFRSGQ